MTSIVGRAGPKCHGCASYRAIGSFELVTSSSSASSSALSFSSKVRLSFSEESLVREGMVDDRPGVRLAEDDPCALELGFRGLPWAMNPSIRQGRELRHPRSDVG